jgi:hypothetical protein
MIFVLEEGQSGHVKGVPSKPIQLSPCVPHAQGPNLSVLIRITGDI